MTKEEIKDFKKFLHEKNIFLMFTQNYRNYRLTINPPTWEAYLENARVENVIPQAFVYPKSIYDKDFWLAMHEEWQKRISAKRAVYREATQLEYLDLEIIDVEYGGLKKGGQETFDSHAAHPKPTDCRCGADVQSSERHRGEVQTWHYQFTV